MAQVAHGAFEFSLQYPDVTQEWFRDSNFIVVLAVPTLANLEALSARLDGTAKIVRVYEPDVNDELTCLVVGPDPDIARSLSHIPLALKGVHV
jgi:peptidyl-tRNA hydrolase